MKKVRALAALLAALVLLAGCGGKQNNGENASGYPSPAQITTAEMIRTMRPFSKWDVRDTVDKEFCTEITLDGDAITVGGKGATVDGTRVVIETAGDYYFTGTLSDGQIVVNADPLDKIRLIFGGVDITCSDSACLLVRMADKVLITLEEGTENRFADTGKPYVAKDGLYGVDAVIFAKEDITVNGAGSMTVEAGYAHGICTKDDLVFLGGTVRVSAADKGIVGEDSVRVQNCDITVTSGDDAIHTKTDYKEGKGFIYLESGRLTLSCGDDAMHAATALLADGADVTISECKEGMEAATVVIGGGTIGITSSDDGINASYLLGEEEPYDAAGANDPHIQEDAYIRIEGGEIHIDAEGDGLDTNGTLYLEGGTVLVDGPSETGNVALDSGCGIYLNGGTVYAIGDAAEAETIREESKQAYLEYIFAEPVEAGSGIVIRGPGGETVYRTEAAKTFSHIVFSSTQMGKGEYTVTVE